MEADPELTKAFQELQAKKVEAVQHLDSLDAKIAGTARAVKISELTLAEVAQQDASAKLYRNVGRAYFLSSKDKMEDLFRSKVTRLSENIRNFNDSKVAINNELKEAENSIRELITKKRQGPSS
ncbi:hypothetical protein RvY_09253 [Ramazzottius varieornatus]|uniref:Prefoldin subunit 1 n=1 Tax=Ramazzottius varieornatus TaxID=947166 RepID=A0A1D1V8T0_RAMVA|nr:hypothetical protein RvY_09253 [Ramazzottius varieornatus]